MIEAMAQGKDERLGIAFGGRGLVMGTIQELTGVQFPLWSSNYGPRTSSISITGNLSGMQILRSHAIPTESEALWVGLSHLF